MILTPSFPVISCDRSNGRYRGVIYISWSDLSAGPNDSNIWVVNFLDDSITQVNPSTLEVLNTYNQIGDGPYRLVLDETGLWVALRNDRRLIHLDLHNNQ